MKVDDPSYPVWHLLKTILPTDVMISAQTAPPPIQREFMEIVGGLPQNIERTGRCMCLNASGFSEELGLSGNTQGFISEKS